MAGGALAALLALPLNADDLVHYKGLIPAAKVFAACAEAGAAGCAYPLFVVAHESAADRPGLDLVAPDLALLPRALASRAQTIAAEAGTRCSLPALTAELRAAAGVARTRPAGRGLVTGVAAPVAPCLLRSSPLVPQEDLLFLIWQTGPQGGGVQGWLTCTRMGGVPRSCELNLTPALPDCPVELSVTGLAAIAAPELLAHLGEVVARLTERAASTGSCFAAHLYRDGGEIDATARAQLYLLAGDGNG